jgi:hypothetical protein
VFNLNECSNLRGDRNFDRSGKATEILETGAINLKGKTIGG